MIGHWTTFPGGRPVSDWIDPNGIPVRSGRGQGFALDWYALDSWAKSRASGEPCEVVIVAEVRYDDGTVTIDGINPEWLRWKGYEFRGGHLVRPCVECGKTGGDHSRSCSLG